MFVICLPAINFRGNRSPYLWWFYKFLHEFGEEAAYICGEEYFLDPRTHADNARAEASPEVAAHYQYRIPEGGVLGRLPRADIADHVWQSLEARFPGNPLEAFRHFCLEEDAPLYGALAQALEQIASKFGNIEAVITCVNCASLQHLCKDQGVPLLHVELGPLRSPEYLQTAYFDFSGVNGNTECRHRYDAAASSDDREWHEIAALRALFMLREPEQIQPTVDLGIGLQVEDDSNIVCYSNGYSSLSLLNHARRMLAEQRIKAPVLVRGHPGSIFSLKNLPAGLRADQSATAIDFIRQCRGIHSINSSLAVEALLLGRRAAVYGEGPFAYCIDAATHQCDESAFSFFLLNYLVPWKLALSADYIRWRLAGPAENAIREAHVEFHMQEKIRLLEARVAELERAVAERDQQIIRLKSSFSWYLTYPLRAISRLILRLLRPGEK